jgi:hypothetical protein
MSESQEKHDWDEFEVHPPDEGQPKGFGSLNEYLNALFAGAQVIPLSFWPTAPITPYMEWAGKEAERERSFWSRHGAEVDLIGLHYCAAIMRPTRRLRKAANSKAIEQ